MVVDSWGPWSPQRVAARCPPGQASPAAGAALATCPGGLMALPRVGLHVCKGWVVLQRGGGGHVGRKGRRARAQAGCQTCNRGDQVKDALVDISAHEVTIRIDLQNPAGRTDLAVRLARPGRREASHTWGRAAALRGRAWQAGRRAEASGQAEGRGPGPPGGGWPLHVRWQVGRWPDWRRGPLAAQALRGRLGPPRGRCPAVPH